MFDLIYILLVVDMARVKVELPGQGESWFFISQDETVKRFIEELKHEEDKIEKIEVL